MKRLIAAVALLLMAQALVWAADAENSVQGQFYSFIAPILSNTQYYGNNGTSVGGINTGFGGEVLINKGVGVGIELGYARNWAFSETGSELGVGSVDVTYHFLGNNTSKKIEPFLTGGYSLYYGERTTTQSGFNLGGGVNIWVFEHAALRLEIRGQGGINHFDGFSQFTHYIAFRFGMTFR